MRLILALLLLGAFGAGEALAQTSPFGVGLPEPGGSALGAGPFGQLMATIAAEQAAFYRALTGALKALKEDGTALPSLASLSFLYGVFHAAGPGHGKVVLTSYMLANEATLKRGVLLAFAASAVQASAAVALVALFALGLGATSMAMTEAARVLEIASYAAIVALGAVLLWTKLGLPRLAFVKRPRLRAASVGAAAVEHRHDDECGCGHAHLPHPRAVETRGAGLSAVFAIGARPCTGAIVVLVFALSQGLFSAGIASAYVMGIGTAVTVAALAALAVFGKRAAIGLLGMNARGNWAAHAHRAVEILGASLVLALGLVLLSGSLVSAASQERQ